MAHGEILRSTHSLQDSAFLDLDPATALRTKGKCVQSIWSTLDGSAGEGIIIWF